MSPLNIIYRFFIPVFLQIQKKFRKMQFLCIPRKKEAKAPPKGDPGSLKSDN